MNPFTMRRLRVATYNIHKARGLDGRTRVERIARVLAQVDADVIALQEVISRDGPSIEDHQASYLANEMGFFHAIGETRKHRGGVGVEDVDVVRGARRGRKLKIRVPGRRAARPFWRSMNRIRMTMTTSSAA